jgi:TadE-like protein
MRGPRRRRGQATVEFALALPLFVMLVLGVIDFGRAVYLFNGVSQAAREIARATSLHPSAPLGASPEATAVVTIQNRLVPGITAIVFHCEDTSGATVPGDGDGGCAAPDVVRVEVHAAFAPTALLGLFGTLDIGSSSSNQMQ